MSSLSQQGVTHLGMDVHKDSISVAILRPDDSMDVEKLLNDAESVRRFIARMGEPKALTSCYEAGPTGYELARQLEGLGVRCRVVAPSLIPRAPGDRVKTDRRDCRRLARLDRAGELVAIRVPTPAEEAVRDLCRARADIVIDLDRARRRLGAFCLRHGRIWRGGVNWTGKHEEWLMAQRFDDPALTATFAQYRGVVEERRSRLVAIESDLFPYCEAEPYAEPVHRLCCYRGLDWLGALTLVTEVCDWRRFANAGSFMSFVGLVASEHSSGASVHRGHITRAGNEHLRSQLVESAWAYQRGPYVGVRTAKAQAKVTQQTRERAWKAQVRLCGRFRRLAARKNVQVGGGDGHRPGALGIPVGGDDRMSPPSEVQPRFPVGRS